MIKKMIYLKDSKILENDKILKKNDIFITFSSGSLSHVGKVAFIENNTNYYAGGFMGIIRVKAYEEILPQYLFYILSLFENKQNIESISNGNNINNISSKIKFLKIPIPPIEIQEKTLEEIALLSSREKKLEDYLATNQIQIQNVIKICLQ